MSTLTNTQISQTYPGLLKLDDSTTGITSSLQAVQDGLGNNTGLKIATNRLEGGNLMNAYRAGVAQYYGTGFQNTGTAPTNSGNILSVSPFYDNGVQGYSAFTINVTTLAAGESIDVAFYNAQYLDGYGYVPYQRVVSAVNVPTTSTGFKTNSFPTTLSFSGTGPGIYFLVTKWNSVGVTPTTRCGVVNSTTNNYVVGLLPSIAGFVYNSNSSMAPSFWQGSAAQTNVLLNQYNTATLPATWTATELNTLSASVASNYNPGFLLHTIR
jgi:hypothetical protein